MGISFYFGHVPTMSILHEVCMNINLFSIGHWMKKLWCLNSFVVLIRQFEIFGCVLLLPPQFGAHVTKMIFEIVNKIYVHSTKLSSKKELKFSKPII